LKYSAAVAAPPTRRNVGVVGKVAAVPAAIAPLF